MKTIKEVQDYIEDISQSAYNKYAKPLIKKEMKRFKIESVEYSMGVIFFRMKDGKVLSSDEFNTTDARNKFLDEFIYPWLSDHFFTLINTDIKPD
jgi:hypothetical protein